MTTYKTANPAKGDVLTVQQAREAGDPRALYEVFLVDGPGAGIGRIDELELWVGEWELFKEEDLRLVKVGSE